MQYTCGNRLVFIFSIGNPFQDIVVKCHYTLNLLIDKTLRLTIISHFYSIFGELSQELDVIVGNPAFLMLFFFHAFCPF